MIGIILWLGVDNFMGAVRAELKPIGPIARNWVLIPGVIHSRLFKYTQHTVCFTEIISGPVPLTAGPRCRRVRHHGCIGKSPHMTKS